MAQVQSAASRYLDRGWSIIPADPATKQPLVPWKDYQERRATGSEVQQWARRFGQCGIAVIGGPVSNLLILDADGQEGVAEIQKLGIPTTPTAHTPRGGMHCYFRWPEGEQAFRNSCKLGSSRKLDVRGKAAYVLAPHTKRPDGKKYEWVHGPDTKLAEAPDWFVRMLVKGAGEGCRAQGTDKDTTNGGGSGSGGASSLLQELPTQIRRYILDGHDLEVFPSRSECDHVVIATLLAAGAQDELVEDIFNTYPIGEKYRESRSGKRYLERTIRLAQQQVRTVRIKYADVVGYENEGNMGMRLQLCLVIAEGYDDGGQILRCGITVPDAVRSDEGYLRRWQRFFRAARLSPPTRLEQGSYQPLIGRRMRVHLEAGRRANPIAGFYSIT
jgi:hypothetical protein